MSLLKLLLLACFAGAIAVVIKGGPRLAAIGAFIVSLLQVLMVFGVLSLSLKGFPLTLIFAITLSVCGLVAYWHSAAKLAVAGATLVSMVGIIQLLQALKVV